MTHLQVNTLKKGDMVNHKKYGICEVQKLVKNFGPVILPITEDGSSRLLEDLGSDVLYPFCELSWKRNIQLHRDSID